MPASVAITPRRAPSWVTRFGKVSIGPPRSLTPPTSCGPARVASSTLERYTSRPMLCRPSPSHGRLPCGDWTLVGPLQKAPGGFTHLLVAVDKLSKWIEARPIGKIKSEQAVLFFTDIVFRFGGPNS